MRIAIFGATAGVGRHLVTEGCERGHEVTAFARTPSKLGADRERVRVVSGDVHDAAAVDKAVEGQEAVLVALGSSSLLKRDDSCSAGTRAILASMGRHGVRRIVVCTSKGVGDSARYMALPIRVLLRLPLEDKEEQEALVRASTTDWTIVRPGRLTDDPPRGNLAVVEGRQTPLDQISRADVAVFMIDQMERDLYRLRSPMISWSK
jgi:putative NADH-flavin reductase